MQPKSINNPQKIQSISKIRLTESQAIFLAENLLEIGADEEKIRYFLMLIAALTYEPDMTERETLYFSLATSVYAKSLHFDRSQDAFVLAGITKLLGDKKINE